jgi:hypothetical protein
LLTRRSFGQSRCEIPVERNVAPSTHTGSAAKKPRRLDTESQTKPAPISIQAHFDQRDCSNKTFFSGVGRVEAKTTGSPTFVRVGSRTRTFGRNVG